MKPPQEFKVVSLRECPTPESLLICETPEQVAEYWRLNIATNPYYNPECECLAVLLLNTRRRVKGHQLLDLGTMDTLLVTSPRSVPGGGDCVGGGHCAGALTSHRVTRRLRRRTSKSRAT